MNKYLLLLSIASLAFSPSISTHPIIYMISPPRSLSVAFLRMMSSRGDFKTFNEPSQFVYVYQWELRNNFHILDKAFVSGLPTTYEQVKEQILSAAQHRPVFVKEISFAVADWFKTDKEFMQHPDIYFVFLIRNPHHSTISFFKKLKLSNLPITFNDVKEWVGYESLYEIFNMVTHHALRKPVVIRSEDLYLHPAETIQHFCEQVAIPFDPRYLAWQSVSSAGEGEWYELKQEKETLEWHGDAMHSTGFNQPTVYETDHNGQPTFSEINDDTDRQLCKDVYAYNKKFYDLCIDSF